MTRFMADSTSIADDPALQLIGYYVDGNYELTDAEVRAWFPSAVLVPISAVGADAGIVGDCEPGCMTITQVIAWTVRRRAQGFDPTNYVNQTYGWGPLRAAYHAAGVPEPHYWVADYDGIAVLPTGAVAKQYQNPPLTGGHFDRSIVVDYWPGVDNLLINVLRRAPTRAQGGDGTMIELSRPDGPRAAAVIIGTDLKIYHLDAPDDETLNETPTIHGFDTGAIKPVPGTLGAKWSTDLGSIVVSWTGTDDQVYRGAFYGNGTMARAWTAVGSRLAAPVKAAVPSSSPGPVGPTGPAGPLGPSGPPGPVGPAPDATSVNTAIIAFFKKVLGL